MEQERRQLLLLNDEFIGDVAEFRGRHFLPIVGLGKGSTEQYHDNLLARGDEAYDDMVRHSKHLSEKYAIFGTVKGRGLEYFLITGDEDTFLGTIANPLIGITPVSKSNHDSSNRIQSIDLHIYKHTRQEDVIKMWPEIVALQKMMAGGKKATSVPSGVTKEHIEIYKLRKDGISSKDVGDKFDLSYKEVDDIYRNLKEKIRKV